MPTLESIQGSSLAPRTDLIENLRQGTMAGRQIAETRQLGRIDKILAEAQAQQPVTGGAVTPGAPPAGAPAATGAGAGAAPAGAPAAPQRAPSYLDVLTSPQIQQQLVQAGGIQGYNMAVRLNELAVAQQARRTAARQRQMQDLANISIGVKEQDFGAQTQMLLRMKSEFPDDPAIQNYADRILSLPTKDERDVALTRTIDRATTVAESLAQRQDELANQVEQQKLQIRAREAGTAEFNALTQRGQLALDNAELDQRVAEFEARPDEEQRALADTAAKPVLDKATAAVSIGNQTLMITRRMKDLIEQIEASEGGPASLALQEQFARVAGQIAPQLGERVREAMRVPGGADAAALRTLAAETLATQIAEMSKAGFSNADLEAQARRLPQMSAASTEELSRVIDEVEQSVNSSVMFAQDVINTSVAPVEQGGGGMGVMRKVTENARAQRGKTNQMRWPNAPPIGTVEEGMEYTGGDPANPNSWRPAGG